VLTDPWCLKKEETKREEEKKGFKKKEITLV